MRGTDVSSVIFLGLLSMGVLAAQTQNQQHLPAGHETSRISAQVPAPPETLKTTFGDKSATWTVAQLAALPHKTITVHNEHTKADETYSGVEVLDLLKPLGVNEKPRGKDLRLYLVAQGSDLYEVVYAIGEVIPDVHSATVVVADTENGKPLAADGPLKMVATGENRPARWVRNLVALKVLAAE